jgi:hypothetical protein
MKAFQEQETSLNVSWKFHFVGADIVCLQKKPVYLVPFLVSQLICIVVEWAVVFIGGFIATVISRELHLMIIMFVVAVIVCKYHFENCVINFLFLF